VEDGTMSSTHTDSEACEEESKADPDKIDENHCP